MERESACKEMFRMLGLQQEPCRPAARVLTARFAPYRTQGRGSCLIFMKKFLDILATRGTFLPHSRLERMRVSTKMTLGLSATCLVIMGLRGYSQLRSEEHDLRAEVE